MKSELLEIPDVFWDIYERARTDQLVFFGWNGREAAEFVKSEVAARKKIAEEWGPEKAVFAVVKRPEFPLHGEDPHYLKVLTEAPFEHVVEETP